MALCPLIRCQGPQAKAGCPLCRMPGVSRKSGKGSNVVLIGHREYTDDNNVTRYYGQNNDDSF
eukprot:scaffold12116_cov167-Ochromonas_danica.AAC.1